MITTNNHTHSMGENKNQTKKPQNVNDIRNKGLK